MSLLPRFMESKRRLFSLFIIIAAFAFQRSIKAQSYVQGQPAATLRDVEVNDEMSLESGQLVEGLGLLSLKQGQLTIRYLTPRGGLPEPNLLNYHLASGQHVLDVIFTGTPAQKGGTVTLDDGVFEKITVGQTTQGHLLVRLLVRPEESDGVKEARLVNDSQGLSLILNPVKNSDPNKGGSASEANAGSRADPLAQQGHVPPLLAPPLEIPKNGGPGGSSADFQGHASTTRPQTEGSEQGAAQGVQGGNSTPLSGVPFSFWQSVSLILALLSALGFGGLALIKIKRKGGLFSSGNDAPLMQVVSSLSLAPKRQILLVKIRDQEFAVASTEGGLQFLTPISPLDALRTSATSHSTGAAAPWGNSTPSGGIKARNAVHPALEATGTGTAASSLETSANQQQNMTSKSRVDLLMNAIKESRSSRSAQSPSAANEDTSQKKQTASTPAKGNSGSSPFQKFLTQSFAKEQQRNVTKTNTKLTEEPQSAEEEIDVDNVTDLIRQKLKQMNQRAS